ncbi:hypothetical protein [Paenibacillus silviterrae]|uniref:hypothetical protein n=1 Tax=Paenibacillus silviterrae TaxID=3242194 RepID=UPI002542749B|nr:hypothetical protein [Paenibacillus chinjuensis]
MPQITPLNWDAQWIWSGEEESPRNEWKCFHRSFDAQDKGLSLEKVKLRSARCWPFEQSYETYEFGHLIKPGRRNTLTVLVQHFGVSTFCYVHGREGRTIRHPGQDSRAPPHVFAERIDANN